MYKSNTKYKLIGYVPISITYSQPLERVAEYKNGSWYPWGIDKKIKNFVIEQVIEEL